MRFILLGTTLLGASFALPFVEMEGQPVDAVDGSNLQPTAAAEPDWPTPEELALLAPDPDADWPTPEELALLAPEADPDWPTPEEIARFEPEADPDWPTPEEIALLAPDAADPGVRALTPPRTGAAPVPPAEDAPETDLAEVTPGITAPSAEIVVPAALPMPDLTMPSGGLTFASLLPGGAISRFFGGGDDVDESAGNVAGSAPEDRPAPVPDDGTRGVVIASLAPGEAASAGALAPADLPPGALMPLAEEVGGLIRTSEPAVSLALVEFAPETVVPEAADPEPETPVADVPAPATEPAARPRPSAETVAGESPAGPRMKVVASLLNLRSGPSSRHSVVMGLSRGDEAEVIEIHDNGWVRVRVSGTDKEGWAFRRYLRETGDT